MRHENKALADRVAILEGRIAELGSYLLAALGYVVSDPQSSLTKSRIVLEKTLLALYRVVMKKEPSRPMIGDMLSDKLFTASIPRRIVARMNAVRDMSNLGPHGEAVDATDAVRVMQDLVDVLEWYVANYDASCLIPCIGEERQSLEILPQLRSKYSEHLRQEIVSAKFVQSRDRCYLEMTTTEAINDYLQNEITKRTDLAFIAGPGGTGDDGRLFSPLRAITDNAHRFVANLDEYSIIMCTDLFTPEAAEQINARFCQQHGS